MGIPPGECEYKTGSHICFPLDMAPTTLYATVTDVKPGDFHWASPGFLPNGMYVLKWQSPNFYWGSNANFHILIEFSVATTRCRIEDSDNVRAFLDDTADKCAIHFDAIDTIPDFRRYYDGQVVYTHRCPSIRSSFLRAADKIGVIQNVESYAEVFPVDDDKAVYRYANKPARNNIKFLFDTTS